LADKTNLYLAIDIFYSERENYDDFCFLNKASVCSFLTLKIPFIPIFLVETVLKCKRYFITMTTKVVESGGKVTICGEQW